MYLIISLRSRTYVFTIGSQWSFLHDMSDAELAVYVP